MVLRANSGVTYERAYEFRKFEHRSLTYFLLCDEQDKIFASRVQYISHNFYVVLLVSGISSPVRPGGLCTNELNTFVH